MRLKVETFIQVSMLKFPDSLKSFHDFQRSSRLIISSPEESTKKKTTKRHKLCKRQIKVNKAIPPKQKNMANKGTFSKSRIGSSFIFLLFSNKAWIVAENVHNLINYKGGRNADHKQNRVKETVPIVSFSDVESESGIVENATAGKIANDAVTEKAKNVRTKKWTGNDNTRLKVNICLP